MPKLLLSLILVASASAQTLQPAPAPPATDIHAYIANGWQTLSRSMVECKSVVDPKVTTTPILYLPAGLPTPPEVTAMQQQCHVEVRSLPHKIKDLGDLRPSELPKEGLLYLPKKYVVPGGRFNEMYGWDSYFILLGLVHDKQLDLARGMVENFFFEIENYGAILNANRTYFFTRSQPPFLSSMIREVYEAPGAVQDPKWLAHAYDMARRDYALWTSPAHQAGSTGLARYHDLGEGPVPEMADDSAYYPDVIRYLESHPDADQQYLVPDSSDPATIARTSCDTQMSKVCAAAVVDGHRLSAAYFRGDRAMRESGFDTSFRFGTFSGSTDHYAPVCLNALLFKYEQDMAHLATLLHRPAEAASWKARAEIRHQAIDKYLWNPAAGMYVDYDYVDQRRSTYHYVTTFYPLWAASPRRSRPRLSAATSHTLSARAASPYRMSPPASSGISPTAGPPPPGLPSQAWRDSGSMKMLPASPKRSPPRWRTTSNATAPSAKSTTSSADRPTFRLLPVINPTWSASAGPTAST